MTSDPIAYRPRGLQGDPDRLCRLSVLCDFYHRLRGRAIFRPPVPTANTLQALGLLTFDPEESGEALPIPEVGPVINKVGSLTELSGDVGSDVIRWTLLADSPAFAKTIIDEPQIRAAWKQIRRVEALLRETTVNKPSLECDDPYLPAPHKSITGLRTLRTLAGSDIGLIPLLASFSALAPKTAKRLWS